MTDKKARDKISAVVPLFRNRMYEFNIEYENQMQMFFTAYTYLVI